LKKKVKQDLEDAWATGEIEKKLDEKTREQFEKDKEEVRKDAEEWGNTFEDKFPQQFDKLLRYTCLFIFGDVKPTA
jgi:hypothetical protein